MKDETTFISPLFTVGRIMSAFNGPAPDLDVNLLNQQDYLVIQRRIQEQARGSSSNEMEYRFLVNDQSFCQSVVQTYVALKRTLIANQGDRASVKQPSRTESEGYIRDCLTEEYGVIMSQFQTAFKDTTYDSLKQGQSEERLKAYQPKIGCLGMKSFDFEKIPQPAMVEAMYLYILDDIEEKQRAAKSRAGLHFLEKIGMDPDLSSYYHAHRKSNHGGASSIMYQFNDGETFSFRRSCMKHGLMSDKATMDEADAKNAKNHPYQRMSYGPPKSNGRGKKRACPEDDLRLDKAAMEETNGRNIKSHRYQCYSGSTRRDENVRPGNQI
jgi:hypothetical protein